MIKKLSFLLLVPFAAGLLVSHAATEKQKKEVLRSAEDNWSGVTGAVKAKVGEQAAKYIFSKFDDAQEDAAELLADLQDEQTKLNNQMRDLDAMLRKGTPLSVADQIRLVQIIRDMNAVRSGAVDKMVAKTQKALDWYVGLGKILSGVASEYASTNR